MGKTSSFLELGFVSLDSRRKEPLVCQLYESIRKAILGGQLPRGFRLPSTRALAEGLAVSRTTVINAFDQLIAEGYLESGVGKGTFVSGNLPEDKLLSNFRESPTETIRKQYCSLAPEKEFAQDSRRPAVSRQCKRFLSVQPILAERFDRLGPFRPGVPALDEFPLEIWGKLSRKCWQDITPNDLSYGHPLGYMPLREAIAQYVRAFRGVRCEVEQVMVINGTQQAIDCVARLMIDEGDQVWLEDPGYRFARASLIAAGAKIVPVPVDRDGMDVEHGIKQTPKARLAYVTPSHQFPLGVTLSIERRMKLLHWAQKQNALIIEDDYDSEFRYAQRPIPALQGLDQNDRVIYIGSFSKVIFPALGVGYAIVPPDLVSSFQHLLTLVGRPASTADQMVLTEFLQQGHFARHLRRMRKVYEERRTMLVEQIEKHLSDSLQVVGADAGLHCAVRLDKRFDDNDVSHQLAEIGIMAPALSSYHSPSGSSKRRKRTSENGLVLGFACSTPGQIRYAVKKLREVLGP